ncbi:MAG TPA: hypothetical protein VNN79_16820 [Actinomycetota bacterium]|nr:hypothetical protein [Actinomycetota bacterium]
MKKRFAADPELPRRMGAAADTPEKRQRSSLRLLDLWKDPAYQQAQSEMSSATNLIRFSDPAARARQSAAITPFATSPEGRAIRSKVSSENWKDPEIRARMLAGRDDPEYRKMKSEGATRSWENPSEGRERGRRKMAERNSSPEGCRRSAEFIRRGGGWKRGKYECRRGRIFAMRSGWEIAVARWLDQRSYDWDYEPFYIPLPDGSAYVPDFVLVDGRILEVKGQTSGRGVEKVKLCRSLGYRVTLLDHKFLRSSRSHR